VGSLKRIKERRKGTMEIHFVLEEVKAAISASVVESGACSQSPDKDRYPFPFRRPASGEYISVWDFRFPLSPFLRPLGARIIPTPIFAAMYGNSLLKQVFLTPPSAPLWQRREPGGFLQMPCSKGGPWIDMAVSFKKPKC
jgi:hypothetical protein